MSTDCTNDVADDQYDDNGFSHNTGLHRDTGTPFNEAGFNEAGFNADGYDCDGYDPNGWDEDGLHRDTGTEFHPRTSRTLEGGLYDSEGFDRNGWDSEGYNREGYDSEGYNSEGEDDSGRSRCDNGECDSDCSCHEQRRDERRSDLLDSDACVLEETGWLRHRYKASAPTVAFEFECISHDSANEGAEEIRTPFDRAYASLVHNTSTLEGSIAKEDGSLPDDGLEFVTVPMLLDEHRKVLAEAFPRGRLGNGHVCAWDQKKCGMHVHVSRASLSNLTLGKMLCFMHTNFNVGFHVFIAGRMSTYATFVQHRSTVSTGHPSKACQGDKYSALNVKPYTVEFRIFRPSTRLETIAKNLCYCLAIRDFCRQSSLAQDALTWDKFLLWLGTTDARFTYRELDAWLRKQEDSNGYGAYYRTHAKPGIKQKPAA